MKVTKITDFSSSKNNNKNLNSLSDILNLIKN